MIIKLLDNSELVAPDTELEYAALVDLHDTLRLHEPINSNWQTQCKTCGAGISMVENQYESVMAGRASVNYSTKTSNLLIMPVAITRNVQLIMQFANLYGPSTLLREAAMALPDDDINMVSIKGQFIGQFFPINDKTEELTKQYTYARSNYNSRLRDRAYRIKASTKTLRKTILLRNKEIWQTLKGHYGAERQAMIDELELGIKRRKQLKAIENSSLDKWKNF